MSVLTVKLFHAIYLILSDFCNVKKNILCSMCICNDGNHEMIKKSTASVAQDRQMFK